SCVETFEKKEEGTGNKNTKHLIPRHFLTGPAAAPGTAILAACGSSSATDTPKPAAATTAPAAGATTAPAASSAAPAATTAPAATAASTTSAASAAAPVKPAGTTAAGSAAAPAASGTAAAGKGQFASQIDTTGIKKGGHLTEGSVSDIQTFNPILQKDTASGRIHSLVFDNLVNVDPDTLQPVANLATKWEASPDGKVYTFTLKSGVKWHDGQPFSADDVKFSYDLYMNKDTGTARAGELGDRVASVDAKDANTVVFTLKDVVAPFLVSNAIYRIVPKHILGSVAPKDIKNNEFSTGKPVGTGPFKFKEYAQGDHVTLVANPDYHQGAPALDTYIYKYTKDSTALYQQLKTGEVDYYEGYSSDFNDDAKKQTNFTAVAYDTFSFSFYGYNLDIAGGKATPIFQDVAVRQALMYAADRKGIVDKIRNGLSTLAQGTEPVLSWAYQPDKVTVKYDYDLKKANQLLDDAGWKKGSGGIREKDGKKLSFSMYAQSGDKTTEGYMNVFQQNWQDIGVEMKPIYEEFSQFVTRLTQSFDFEAFFVGFSWGVDPDQQTMWDSKQHGPGFNLYSYKNDKVDALLLQGIRTLDQDKRKQIYVDMQNIVLADAPALITDFPKRLAGVNKRVKNLIPNAVNVTIDAFQWYVTDGK
ncbi:MAG: ABC transporter substrate-binding protein, partial [Thermomicrobiales bacterium]